MPQNKLLSAKRDARNEVEASIMLAACAKTLDNLLVRLPLYAGMRIGEVQHLRNTWIDREKGIVQIPARQLCACYECRKWRNGVWSSAYPEKSY